MGKPGAEKDRWMRIGVIQPPYPPADRSVGPLEVMDDMLRRLEAVQDPHDLIVLPECANCPGITGKDALIPFVETHTQRFVGAVSRLAKAKGTAIAVNVLLCEGGRLQNVTLLMDRGGEPVFRYVKTHLSATEARDWQLDAGGGPGVCDWQGIRLGFLTCRASSTRARNVCALLPTACPRRVRARSSRISAARRCIGPPVRAR